MIIILKAFISHINTRVSNEKNIYTKQKNVIYLLGCENIYNKKTQAHEVNICFN